ncbi:MAG: cation transporter [Planctomycetes bacterium]|nr:cation transporter [Planctomycetota bacterium]
MPRCPECKNDGREVKHVTLDSLLRSDRRAEIREGPYSVCSTPECETVYFGGGRDDVFSRSDLAVRFGLKETGSPRRVCYCFDHDIEDIHDEIRRTGRSTVLDRIKAEMGDLGCRCEYTNPLGACCLNTVARVVQEELPVHAAPDATEACCNDSCCATEVAEPQTPPERAGLWAPIGSVLSAALASACCWLPLLLITFGASAAGVAGFFEAYRPYFITAAILLLSIGFYRVYLRKEKCSPDSVCPTPTRRLRTFNRATLWVATALVAVFGLFPNYVGSLFAAFSEAPAPVSRTDLVTAKFRVQGMTCEGCATTLRTALAKLQNVQDVEVDYAAGSAAVRYEADKPVPSSRVIEAAKDAGFEVTLAGAAP